MVRQVRGGKSNTVRPDSHRIFPTVSMISTEYTVDRAGWSFKTGDPSQGYIEIGRADGLCFQRLPAWLTA
jgi:hypothetical protein